MTAPARRVALLTLVAVVALIALYPQRRLIELMPSRAFVRLPRQERMPTYRPPRSSIDRMPVAGPQGEERELPAPPPRRSKSEVLLY